MAVTASSPTRRCRVQKGDWVQLVVVSAPSNSPFVLKPPAQHGDAVALAPLADSEFAAISLVAAEASPTVAMLSPGDVVTIQLAGGFLAWAADAAAADAVGAVPLLWVDEDEVAEADKAALQPCRFRVDSTKERDGIGLCVGASLVLAPERADGSESVLTTVENEDPEAPLRLAFAPPSATASTHVVFTLESVVYSAYPDGIQPEPEAAASQPDDAPVVKVAAEAPTTGAISVNSPVSPAGSSPVVVAADEEGEGEELEVVFEEGDLGITIKRTPTGQARVLRALPGTQAERNGVRAGDLLRAIGGDYDLRSVVLDSRNWADLIQRMKTAPRPLRVTVLRGGPGAAAAMEEGGSELHALERRLDFSGLAGSSSSKPPGLLPLDDRKRALLYRGRLSLLQEGRLFGHSLQPRDAFLLSDALLLVVPPPEGSRQQRATVEAAIGLATCKLRGGTTQAAAAASSLPGTEFGFEVVTPSGSFALFAPSAAARGQWVERMYRGIVALLQLAPHTQRPRRSPCPSPQVSVEQEGQEEPEMEVDLEADALVRHQLVIDTLHSAVLRGHVEEARALLAAACSDNGGEDDAAAAAARLANAQDAAGRTPLHYACLVRRHDLASLLLSRQGGGADPSIADMRGRLPLHLAALALDDVAIALLLSSPASQPLVNARDAEGGRTPAFLAAVHGRLPSNNNYRSTTSASGGEGDEEFALRRCLNALLAHDADVNARDHAGRAPLHLVSSALRFDAARALLDMGADANCYSDDAELTPLMLACRDAATDLAAKRAAPSAAASSPSALEATLQVLQQQGGAQPNLRAGPQGGGTTAVHLLLENGMLDWPDKAKALSVLLSHGARLDVPACEPPVTAQQLIAALLRGEEGGEKKELKAALDAAVGAGKSAWGLKKAGTAIEVPNKAAGAAASKLPEPIVSRLLSKAAARPTIRPMASDAAASGGGAGACLVCGDAFNALTKRPQHCRLCGHQVCGGCSSKKLPVQVPGGSGEAARVCDGCFNWGSHHIAAALAVEAERARGQQEGAAFSGPEAVARARQRREERVQAQAQQEEADQKELFGAKAAALGERAMSWLRGEQAPAGDERRQRQAAAARVSGQMEEVRVGLQQRGERIENLADRTNELVDSSAQFAAMARQLNEQSKGWGGLW